MNKSEFQLSLYGIEKFAQEIEQHVVKSNSLIQKTRYELSLDEQKIILYIISKIKPQETELNEYRIDLKTLCMILGIESKGNYKYLKDVIKGLHDKSFWYYDEATKTDILLSWIQKARIEYLSTEVVIKLDEDLKPYLLQLSEKYTMYEFYNILAMKSKYSIRLYELLKSYANLGSIKISINDLKKMLHCEDKYEIYNNFKKRIIIPAVNEINTYTDLQVEFDTWRTGRNITHILFSIQKIEDVKVLSERYNTTLFDTLN